MANYDGPAIQVCHTVSSLACFLILFIILHGYLVAPEITSHSACSWYYSHPVPRCFCFYFYPRNKKLSRIPHAAILNYEEHPWLTRCVTCRWSLGSVLFLASWMAMMGPWTYIQHLTSGPRLPFTAAYFGSIALTLYFSLGVSSHQSDISYDSEY